MARCHDHDLRPSWRWEYPYRAGRARLAKARSRHNRPGYLRRHARLSRIYLRGAWDRYQEETLPAPDAFRGGCRVDARDQASAGPRAHSESRQDFLARGFAYSVKPSSGTVGGRFAIRSAIERPLASASVKPSAPCPILSQRLS